MARSDGMMNAAMPSSTPFVNKSKEKADARRS